LFYEVKPVRLREQVKRNIKRFPDDFMFQLTPEEVELTVSQNAIPSKQHLGGYLPYVFTEQGVAAPLKDLGKKWFAFSKMDIGAVEMLGKLEKLAKVKI
ncbi:MAG: ORF6N domain-containing protein, partial [Desulfobulbaceae bacterium]|nr:ORF6N domain-containing protein [Desulfobulbaceae bacterium]